MIDSKPQKEYEINRFLKVKLEKDKTIIYVNDEFYSVCKKVILGIPKIPEVMEEQAYFVNIDQAISFLELKSSVKIKPEEEFFGHCSNLQAWVDNDYNCDVLSRTLSVGLLKSLAKCGDEKAKNAYKMEIIKKLESKSENVLIYLFNENALQFFAKEELETLIEEIDDPLMEFIIAYNHILNKYSNEIDINEGITFELNKYNYLKQNFRLRVIPYQKDVDYKSILNSPLIEIYECEDRKNFKRVRAWNRTFLDLGHFGFKGYERCRILIPFGLFMLCFNLLDKDNNSKMIFLKRGESFFHNSILFISEKKDYVIYISGFILNGHKFKNVNRKLKWRKERKMKEKFKQERLKRDKEYLKNFIIHLRYFLRKTEFYMANHKIRGKHLAHGYLILKLKANNKEWDHKDHYKIGSDIELFLADFNLRFHFYYIFSDNDISIKITFSMMYPQKPIKSYSPKLLEQVNVE